MTLLQLTQMMSDSPQSHGVRGLSESSLLAKLQEMVPNMPRERELSKLEIINYVIDYIRQLREMVVIEQAAM